MEINFFNEKMKLVLTYTATLRIVNLLGVGSPNPNSPSPNSPKMSTTISLGTIVGYHTVWSVVPALHSPLYAVHVPILLFHELMAKMMLLY